MLENTLSDTTTDCFGLNSSKSIDSKSSCLAIFLNFESILAVIDCLGE